MYCFTKISIYSILIFIVSLFSSIFIQAANQATIVDGKVIFETTDTKATTGIKWKTVGFTLTRQKCLTGSYANGGYPTLMPHCTLWLSKEYQTSYDIGNGILNIVFTIPEHIVSDALIKSGMGDIKENDILYLHGIFQVTHNGVNYGVKKYDLPAIKSAELWANSNDFADHFDVELRYHGANVGIPVYVEYKTKTGVVISVEVLEKGKWVKPGETVEINFQKEKVLHNKKYTIGHSYYYLLNKPTIKREILYVKDYGYEKVQRRHAKQNFSGIKFVAIMYPEKTKEVLGKKSGDLTEPNLDAIVKADTREKEKFDVEEGIPSGESVYANVFATNYLTEYEFQQRKGTKIYTVNVEKTYYLSWEKEDGSTHTETTMVTDRVYVEREYSYWEIKNLNIYVLDYAKLYNKAFPEGWISLKASKDVIPNVEYWHSNKLKDHIIEPNYPKTIYLEENISGTELPIENFQEMGEGAIGSIISKNDTLTLGGKIIIGEKNTPNHILDDAPICQKDILYLSNIKIPKTTLNGKYDTKGGVYYKNYISIGEKKSELSYPLNSINFILVHTPVVCDGKIENNKSLNQMLHPDITKSSLILGTNFKVQLSSKGYHKQIKGYGYKDYNTYIAKRQVKFPFDVYQVKEKDKITYIPCNSWSEITQKVQEYYLPIWVKEGKYAVEFRAVSSNAISNKQLDLMEELSNLDWNHYVAFDYAMVEVSGRLFGLQLYDVSDYPIWQTVFRKENSLKPTGITYKVGPCDENGKTNMQSKTYTLPLLKGSHPTLKAEGIIRRGYVVRFRLTTIGDMTTNKSFIRIKPSFYFVDKNGENREEVDLYYSETFLGKKYTLVKVGSDLDQSNRKKLQTGDNWLSIPQKELENTAKVRKITLKEWKAISRDSYTFGTITLKEHLRTYIGSKLSNQIGNLSESKILSSKQNWYGEYYLPANVQVVKKGYPVYQYTKEHKIDYKESFWKKDGYIIVNFDIETIQSGTPYLSYMNKKNEKNGYCNMWKKEGFLSEKVDSDGVKFQLQDGDFILYYTKESVSSDYQSGGTH